MNKYVLPLLILIVILFISGCDLQLPESVKITGTPTVEIPGGTASEEFSGFWNIEEELDNLAAAIEGLSRVPTQPGEPYELQLNKEILNIAISDFASETLNFQEINQTIDPQTVDIPSLGLDAQTISQNIDPIAVPAGITLQPVSITGIPEVDGPKVVTDTSDTLDYSDVTFYTGTFEVNITITEDVITPGLVLNLTSADILAQDDSLIVSTNSSLPVNLTTNPTITFPIAGLTIPAAFKLQVTLDIQNGGGITEFFDIDADFAFSGDTTISAATGIDIDETVSDSTTIVFDPGSEFVSAVIGTGDVAISIDYPATWSNIDTSIDITLFQNAVQIASGSGVTPYTLDLSGVSLASGDIIVQYQVTVSGVNASFDLDPAADEISGNIAPSITNLATLVLSPQADLDFSQAIAEPIDPAILDLVSSATFSNPVISVSITNDLPFAIDVSLDSPELDLDPVTANHTFPATGSEDTWTLPFLTGSSNVLTMSSPDIVGDNEINLDLVVTIPGYDSGTNELTLTNITPGTSYSLSGSVSADLSLSQLVIQTGSFSGTFPDTTAGEIPMDFSMLGNILPDTIDITGIEALLDISLDSSAGTLSMYLAAHYTDPVSGSSIDEDLIGVPGTPVFIPASGVISIDGLEDIINARPQDLTFTYEVAASGTTINVTGMEEEISANINVSIPLLITSNGDTELFDENGDPIILAPEGDLFGRAEGDENEFLEMIKSITLHADIDNNTGIDFRIDIITADFLMNVSCITGPLEIELTQDQVDTIINTIPFNPDVHLIVPDGPHSVNTDSTFDITTWFEIVTDLEYTIDFKGGKK